MTNRDYYEVLGVSKDALLGVTLTTFLRIIALVKDGFSATLETQHPALAYASAGLFIYETATKEKQ